MTDKRVYGAFYPDQVYEDLQISLNKKILDDRYLFDRNKIGGIEKARTPGEVHAILGSFEG